MNTKIYDGTVVSTKEKAQRRCKKRDPNRTVLLKGGGTD